MHMPPKTLISYQSLTVAVLSVINSALWALFGEQLCQTATQSSVAGTAPREKSGAHSLLEQSTVAQQSSEQRSQCTARVVQETRVRPSVSARQETVNCSMLEWGSGVSERSKVFGRRTPSGLTFMHQYTPTQDTHDAPERLGVPHDEQ